MMCEPKQEVNIRYEREKDEDVEQTVACRHSEKCPWLRPNSTSYSHHYILAPPLPLSPTLYELR